MRVLAYCAAQFKESTRRAAGVEPLTCPPISFYAPSNTLYIQLPKLLYLALHGQPGSGLLWGDDQLPALSVTQVEAVDWRQIVVFAATCYFPQTPFLDAFLAGGAVVIAGEGQNWSPPNQLAGASLLGLWVRRGLGWGLSPERALQLAKVRVRAQTSNRAAARDALQFRVYRG